jgi:hypothetical protein
MKAQRLTDERSQKLFRYILSAILFVHFVLLAVLMGCKSGPIWGKKTTKPELPPGVVLPQEKMETWKTLVKSVKDSQSASVASSQLLQAFKSEDDPQMRVELLRMAGALPPEACWPLAEVGLQDTDPNVQIEACRLAAKSKATQTIDRLAGLAQGATDQDVRQAAIKALGQFKDPAVAAVLGKVLQDRNPAIQYLAIRSLRENTGQDFGYDIAKWQAYLDGQHSSSRASGVIATRNSRQF